MRYVPTLTCRLRHLVAYTGLWPAQAFSGGSALDSLKSGSGPPRECPEVQHRCLPYPHWSPAAVRCQRTPGAACSRVGL